MTSHGIISDCNFKKSWNSDDEGLKYVPVIRQLYYCKIWDTYFLVSHFFLIYKGKDFPERLVTSLVNENCGHQ